MTASTDEDHDHGMSAGDDEALTRLYRAGAERSPEALDQAVLARAAEALLAKQRRRRQRLRNWSLAASLVLVAGLGLRLREEAPPIAFKTQLARPAAQPEATKTSVEGRDEPRAAPPPETKQAGSPADWARTSAPVAAPKPASRSPSAPVEAKPPDAIETRSGAAKKEQSKPTGSQPPQADEAARQRDAGSSALPAMSSAFARNAAPAADRSNDEIPALLNAIRALPPEARFVALDPPAELTPAAFADRMAEESDATSLLKAAARWRLRQVDGSLVPADDWLRRIASP